MGNRTQLIPRDAPTAVVQVAGKKVRLTNLNKVFWPTLGFTKGDLLEYYLRVSPVLVPHLQNRAMVMKRYPHGIEGEYFFMKRAPAHRPEWVRICSIEHASKSIIDFAVIDDAASLLWVVNLGSIDLNPWYARCDDVNRPDYLHFDLDPVKGKPVPFGQILEVARIVRDALGALGIRSHVKTTGSRGLHVYVPIERGPTQKEVWAFAKSFALALAAQHPRLITAEYRLARRPQGRVLVDYNQNAWGRTLASVYSVRPRPEATVSAPVTWDEVEAGFAIEDFRMDNMPERIEKLGDLFRPILLKRGRVKLEKFFETRMARKAG